jgi:uncharacterized protein
MKNKKYALITGATSGIGAEFAKQLAEKNYNLILTGRRENIIQELAKEIKEKQNIDIKIIIADLSKDEDVKKIIKQISHIDSLEFLVNNAGYGTKKSFFEDSFENQEQMLKVHINALARLTHATTPQMIKNKKGYIVNVSSIASFLSSPTSEFYCATKAFITNYSESLHLALKNSNIKVQALCPGFTRTDFHQKLDICDTKRKDGLIIKWMNAEDVVKISLTSLKKRNHVIIVPGFWNKILNLLIKVIPKRIYYKIAESKPQPFTD